MSESVHPHRFRKTLGSVGTSLGMDPFFVQKILGHRNVRGTLESYSEPDIEVVKRQFAEIDLLSRRRSHGPTLDGDGGKTLDPARKEAIQMVVRGLLLLIGERGSKTSDAKSRAVRPMPRGQRPQDLRLVDGRPFRRRDSWYELATK